MTTTEIEKICRLLRYDILTSTTAAGSGHPTSSLSSVELMSSLFFGGHFHFDLKNPESFSNDRIIFSKGHASPLFYSLYHAAGEVKSNELLTLRKFGSALEGHPNPRFKYADVATGSLGQGLSNGLGMALGIKLRISRGELEMKRTPKVWVLLGDSEMAEGQIWEAAEIASFYKLNNLVGIIDVNRLGQFGETEVGWDVHDYQKKLHAFGWETIIINNGHNLEEINRAFLEIEKKRTVNNQKPFMVIARTVKGKGVDFLENKGDWHGKALDNRQLKTAVDALGKIEFGITGKISLPEYKILPLKQESDGRNISELLSKLEKKINSETEKATREAYGDALALLGEENQNIVVLDAEVANSTFQNKFQKRFPTRFFEMFIAEENMMAVAVGLSKIGFIPYISTFAAFLTQTYDQVRMAQYSKGNLKIVGSHAGVSIGEDGPSQMGLEDISMMRSILDSVVLYPSDTISTRKLTTIMSKHSGISYMRTTRAKTPEIYNEREDFEIGGLKIHHAKNKKPKAIVIAAGITFHEAMIAKRELERENIMITLIDLYSVKPVDSKTLIAQTALTDNVIVVEDHYPYGGIGEAIGTLGIKFRHLCVRKMPMSGSPEELLKYEEIDASAIVKAVKSL